MINITKSSISCLWCIIKSKEIIKKDKTILMKYEMHTKKWKYNMPKIAEAVVLLDLITILNKKLHYITHSNISISIDNKKIWKIIHEEIILSNQYNQDATTEIIAIKRIIEQSLIEMTIDSVLAHKESRQIFE